MSPLLLYVAAGITGMWGTAHLFATKGVVAGFGTLSSDNRRILTMEWIVEGVALISIAAFVAVTAAIRTDTATSHGIYAVAIGTLTTLAVVSLFTGFKVAYLPFRLCPMIFISSAVLIAVGAWL